MLKKALIFIVAIVVAYLLGLYGHRPSPAVQESLPEGVKRIISVDRAKVVDTTRGGSKVAVMPKFGAIEVRVRDNGDVVLATTGYMPIVGIRPYLGASYCGKIEPLLGVQLVRVEPWGLGLGVDATPSLVGVSLNKDVLANSIVGIGVGATLNNLSRQTYIHFSLAF